MKSFSVQIPQYEGPLDLLLSIVRRNELPITDLPLAPIAAQYLAYIKEAEALDVNLGMEWIDIAARLIQWKSSSLLPVDPALPDPGASLVQELSRELKTFSDIELSEAKEFLADRNEERDRLWTRGTEDSFREPLPAEEEPFASLWTVRRKAQTIRNLFLRHREHPEPVYDVAEETVTIDEMLDWVRHRIEELEPGARVSSELWFAEMATVGRKIGLFLALLEVAMSSEVRLDASLGEHTFWIEPDTYRYHTDRDDSL